MTGIARLVKVADFFTIGNLACGMTAIFASAEARPVLASSFIFLALILDSLDGKVAGWMHQKSEFGKQLDSLADLVSFGVAPAFLYFAQGHRHWVESVVLILFVACGMLRLARYNISDGVGFEGVPITVNGLVFPALVWLGIVLPQAIAAWPFVFIAQSLLMISSFRVGRLF